MIEKIPPTYEELWGKNNRMYSYARYLTHRFGGRVQKLTLNVGLGCPHRHAQNGGCIYCNNAAFTPSYCTPNKSITQQLQEGMAFHAHRYRRSVGYLAYFQSYTNTWAPTHKLQALYQEALSVPGIVGLVIGTRPDCLPPATCQLLAHIAHSTPIHLELGIETLHDATLRTIQRGHDAHTAINAIRRIHTISNISLGAHLILGLPGETPAMMLQTLQTLCQEGVHSLKFHQLQVIKDTALERIFAQNPNFIHPLSKEEYLTLLLHLIEHVPPHVAIERICAEVPPRFLIAPQWGTLRYDAILRQFNKLLQQRNTWQAHALP